MPSPLATLVEMLSYARPRQTRMIKQFTMRYLAPLPGAYMDRFGNWHVSIGAAPSRVLWSAHTDTVHCRPARQLVAFRNGTIYLPDHSRSSCLGADDTVGCFLMREMILHDIPGHYVFHEGEERGCVGSTALGQHEASWLGQFDYAVAFDRQGTHEIITHQLGMRGCSDQFALALGSLLGPQYRPSDNGVYTDTAQYFGIIPECTNIGVGYSRQHSPLESIDADHVLALRESLLALSQTDLDDLPVKRDPLIYDLEDCGYPWGNSWGTAAHHPAIDYRPFTRTTSILDTIGREVNPDAYCCEDCGFALVNGLCECDTPDDLILADSIYLDPIQEDIQAALRQDFQQRYGLTVRGGLD